MIKRRWFESIEQMNAFFANYPFEQIISVEELKAYLKFGGYVVWYTEPKVEKMGAE